MQATQFSRFLIGPGTTVETGDTPKEFLARMDIRAGANCRIDISGISVLNSSLTIFMGDDCTLTMGPGQSFNEPVRLYMHEPSSITVGAQCLWGSGDIWTSDMHSVIDVETSVRTNPARSVHIGERVWLAAEFMVLGGAEIGDDSVVAARSLVTRKKFPPHSLIAGQPARVIREGIRWDVNRL
ncbi:MAG: hypothetical protein H7226_07155 [Salinibacterium sp.]|nr:hypothetical protein [Salinibacterium sp.]